MSGTSNIPKQLNTRFKVIYNVCVADGGGHYDDYDGNRRAGRGGRYNEY